MATITLAESQKLSQDTLIAGLIEEIITVNPLFESLPFRDIDGNALAYNREDVLGDVGFSGVGDDISARSATTVEQVTSSLTTLGGRVDVSNFIQDTRSNINNQTAIQLAGKIKSAARQYQNTMINGDGTSDSFEGLRSLCKSSQKIAATGTNGDALSFEKLDELMDMVTDKNGQVDFIMATPRQLRNFKSLMRSSPGASIVETVTLPSGFEAIAYNGTALYKNEFIAEDETTGSDNETTSIYAGTFDDGSHKHGIAGLTAANASGIKVTDIGESENKDEHLWRVTWYCGLANYCTKGLAMLTGIKKTLA